MVLTWDEKSHQKRMKAAKKEKKETRKAHRMTAGAEAHEGNVLRIAAKRGSMVPAPTQTRAAGPGARDSGCRPWP